jgi:hypothetical protein
MRTPIALSAALLFLAACRAEPPKSAAPAERPFDVADLAAARALDAALARVVALSAAAPASGGDLALEERLGAAAGAAEAALGRLAQPRDRAAAEPAVAAARRVAAEARSASLAAAREDLARKALDYRHSRAGWNLAAPPEGAQRELDQVRQELEQIESEAGGVAPVAPRDEGHKMDTGGRRLAAETAVLRGRAAAGRLEEPLGAAARRWVEAADRSVRGVLDLSAAPEAERSRLAAAHLAARADALEALAEYTRLRAERGR